MQTPTTTGGGGGRGEDPEDPSNRIRNLLGKADKFKKELFEREGKSKIDTTLRAAHTELEGNQISLAQERGVSYDHITKVKNAQKGLANLIKQIKNVMSSPYTSTAQHHILQEELSQASKLLDYSRGFVP